MLNLLAILVIQENTINIVEAHLLDRKINTSDFYGSALRLCLIGFLRPEQKFTSFDALIEQINADIKQTRELCANHQTVGQIAEGREVAKNFFNSPFDSDANSMMYRRVPLSLGK